MPREVDHDARRAEIVEGVWALVAREGIESVTMRRVAAEAGVSVGRIQHYFDSRADLVRTSARLMVEGAEGRHEAEATTPEAALRHAIDHVVPRSRQERVGATIWLSYVAAAVADPELAGILGEAKRGQEDEVARLLVATGAAGAESARERARMLVGLADGLANRVVIGELTGEEAMTVLRAAPGYPAEAAQH